jgi:hypothetical protein
VSSLLLPAEAVYRRAAALASQGQGSSVIWRLAGPAAGAAAPSPTMIVHAALHLVAAVAGAVWIFAKRDI